MNLRRRSLSKVDIEAVPMLPAPHNGSYGSSLQRFDILFALRKHSSRLVRPRALARQ